MNCEQVEELLSAYLDNMLASEERRLITTHLQTCQKCSETLAEYRRNDMLLARLPRVAPDAALRERIFTSPDYLELASNDIPGVEELVEGAGPTMPRLPAKSPRRDTPGRPQLVALPGGRSTQPTPAVRPAPVPEAPTMPQPAPRRPKRGSGRGVMIAAIAAALILALGISSVIGFNLLSNHPQTTNTGVIPPPSNLQGTPPLSAGARFVFLRDGTLWSVASDGSSKQPQRLTPSMVAVAANWVVSSPLTGRYAGDLLAYINSLNATVHIIRSDGLEDTAIKQALLPSHVSPASVWETDTGMTILNSLAWSPDGTRLAFVGDPTGTDRTNLYIYSTVVGKVSAVPIALAGSVTHPTWSPDGTRLAFEVTDNGVTSIVDYNVLNLGLLTIASGIGAGSSVGDSVLTLDWSPSQSIPAITWSVGTVGHVYSLWLHTVGISDSASAQLLQSGDYAQAIYSRAGDGGVGSWLLVASVEGRAGDILRLDAIAGARIVSLTNGRQVNFAQWSPDGSAIDYFDSLSAGIGTLRVVNATTGTDWLIATGIANSPAPAWSMDSQQLSFSNGTHIGVASAQGGGVRYLALVGAASALTWSLTTPRQLIAALNDGQQGIYVIDTQHTQHNSTLQIDTLGTGGPILWTEIP